MNAPDPRPAQPDAASPDAAAAGQALLIQPGGWRIPLAPGQTLLQAALARGVRLPHSCRNGTCRACLCKLTQGAVRYTIDWPGLLAEEKAEGWILPCVAVAVPESANPLVIEAPGAIPWP